MSGTIEAVRAKRIRDMVVEAWSVTEPVRRGHYGDYHVRRSLNGIQQHCWIAPDEDGDVYVVLFVEFDLAPGVDLNIRLRLSKPPLLGLEETQAAASMLAIADSLSTAQKVKKVTWDEATGKTFTFAGRVPFVWLARMHFVASLAAGQRLSSQSLDSLTDRLYLPARGWKHPDIIAQEEESFAADPKPKAYAGILVGVAFNIAIRERDRLEEQLRLLTAERPWPR